MEPVDTANNVDVPADFLTPFYLTYLTNGDTDAGER
jgi:hypothetical protein